MIRGLAYLNNRQGRLALQCSARQASEALASGVFDVLEVCQGLSKRTLPQNRLFPMFDAFTKGLCSADARAVSSPLASL